MIEPKDGEWWMCETDGVNLVLMWKGSIWVKTKCGHVGAYSMATVKPLYKMVKAEEPKPRTKVVYEPCNFNSRSEAIKYYEDVGELFVRGFALGQHHNINDLDGEWWSIICRNWEILYKVVEKEIDWKDEVKSYIYSVEYLSDKDVIDCVYVEDDSEECEKWDSEFIGMCHLVASLTDKPE